MKAFLVVVLLLATSGIAQTTIFPNSVVFPNTSLHAVTAVGFFTALQFKNFDSLGAGTGGSSCTASTTTCTVTTTAVGAGDTIVKIILGVSTGGVRTLNSGADGGETFTHCASCSFGNTTTGFIDADYVVSAVGGGTSFTCTTNAADSGYKQCIIWTRHWSGATVAFDVSGGAADSACTNCAGTALGLTGTTDFIIQTGIPANNLTAITAPYSNDVHFTSGAGGACSINTNSGAVPTWTQDISGPVIVMALSFKGS